MAKRLSNYNHILIGAAFAVIVQSCGISQLVTGQTASERKEDRKCNRAAKRVERAVKLCPSMAQDPVIVHDTIQVFVPEIKHDTIVLKSDTIEIVKDRWRVRIIDRIDSLYIDGGCDSIYIDVPVQVECPPHIAPTKTVSRSLAWWQIALMVLGAVTIWKALVWVFQGFENRQ